jgi:hypothetical protein
VGVLDESAFTAMQGRSSEDLAARATVTLSFLVVPRIKEDGGALHRYDLVSKSMGFGGDGRGAQCQDEFSVSAALVCNHWSVLLQFRHEIPSSF